MNALRQPGSIDGQCIVMAATNGWLCTALTNALYTIFEVIS